MLIQNNVYEYILLLKQQISLQADLEKCIYTEDSINYLIANTKHLFSEDLGDVENNLNYIVHSLRDIKAANSNFINKLQRHIVEMYKLLHIANNNKH
jgi:hypothetical protein